MTLTIATPLKEHFSDIAEVIHIFYPDAAISQGPEDPQALTHAHHECADWAEDTFRYQGHQFTWTVPICGDAWEQKRRRKRGIKQACYYLFKKITELTPPWGSLTGIRPTRLFHERLEKGEKPRDIQKALTQTFDLREDKAWLLHDTVMVQQPFRNVPGNVFDLYIGIPFCVSRCSYCSFFAEVVGNGQKIPTYIDALQAELQAVYEIVQKAGLIPRSLYVGGGTPTSIGVRPLETVLSTASRLFPGFQEWTVEAGRPDTLSMDMLSMIQNMGVTRISINPQTMNERTLNAIGRSHTVSTFVKAYKTAREKGFAHINMDIIAALPNESESDFAFTCRAIRDLSPDSLTIHALARKHGSKLNEAGFTPTPPEVADAMVEMGHTHARLMGMRPYYLYRQKYVAGNLENVAYALPGKECLYNIDMMEETTSILAVGAGGISKRIFPAESRIERAPNAGDIGHYITRIQDMILRKRNLWQV